MIEVGWLGLSSWAYVLEGEGGRGCLCRCGGHTFGRCHRISHRANFSSIEKKERKERGNKSWRKLEMVQMGLLRGCRVLGRQIQIQTILPGPWDPRSRMVSLLMAMMRQQLHTKLLPVSASPSSTRKGCESSERHPPWTARDRSEGRWHAADLAGMSIVSDLRQGSSGFACRCTGLKEQFALSSTLLQSAFEV